MHIDECKALQGKIIDLRRSLHSIPEIGTDLPETSAFVMSKLESIGIPYTCSKIDSGITAYLRCSRPGRILALRADMDALPITENTGLPFSSNHPGAMHACGHDAHTAMLLGAAEILSRHASDLCGEIRFVFQAAEEQAKGSLNVLNGGTLDDADAIFGLHIGKLLSGTPLGKFVVVSGPLMASYDRFIIHIKGTATHGANPEQGVDTINIAAHIILSLQAIRAREYAGCDGMMLSIGSIHCGQQYNMIPDEAIIEGTTRAFSEESRQYIARRISEISSKTAEAFGGKAETEMDWGAPVVSNNAEMASLASSALTDTFGADDVITKISAPVMTGEDFSRYLEKIPGCFMFLSSENPEKNAAYPHHNGKFDIDEDVLWKGTAAFVSIAERYLGS